MEGRDAIEVNFLNEPQYNYSMTELIYNTREEAAAACKAYADAMQDLQEKLGVFETSDDSCSMTYIQAKWRCEDGEVKTYTYW